MQDILTNFNHTSSSAFSIEGMTANFQGHVQWEGNVVNFLLLNFERLRERSSYLSQFILHKF